MPELPEVEHLRRSLLPGVIGSTVVAVEVARRDVLRGPYVDARATVRPSALLHGCPITALERHGKELAIVAEKAVLCIHLGMSGQLVLEDPSRPILPPTHRHVTWSFRDRLDRLVFRDPRRFGGLTPLPSREQLAGRWADRGVDALLARPAELVAALRARSGGIKSLLLNQSVIAGVGNIYADESLFSARIHPLTPTRALPPDRLANLVRALRTILRRAIGLGGSSVRDYRDACGATGGFQATHTVYGRGGAPCRACRSPLATGTVAGRTTVWCAACQPIPRADSAADS